MLRLRRHGMSDRAERGENGDIKREIGEREHGGARNRPARPQVPVVVVQPHARGQRPDRFDLETPIRPDLRKFGEQKGADIFEREGGLRRR